MSFTNAYWTPPSFHKPVTGKFPVSGHLGITFEPIRQQAVTAGWFFAKPILPNTQRQTISNPQPEYFSVAGQVTRRGLPSKHEMEFNRKKFTKVI